jgi:hypothetical protein
MTGILFAKSGAALKASPPVKTRTPEITRVDNLLTENQFADPNNRRQLGIVLAWVSRRLLGGNEVP